MKIVTVHAHNPVTGAPKVVAKGMGKQKTTPWDLSKSVDWNHGNAAAEFILAKVDQIFTHSLIDTITHTSNDAGTIHTFNI